MDSSSIDGDTASIVAEAKSDVPSDFTAVTMSHDIGSPYPFARYQGIVRFAKVFRGS